jgi:hypothetical protein
VFQPVCVRGIDLCSHYARPHNLTSHARTSPLATQPHLEKPFAPIRAIRGQKNPQIRQEFQL